MKKILAGLLAIAIAVFATVPAFAATTVAQDGTNSITVSSYLSKQNKTITMKNQDGTTQSEQDTVYEVPAGAVVALSKSGSMIYGAAKLDSDGSYIFGGEFGVVDSSYTIPASMADKTLFFIAAGSDESAEPLVFVCHVMSTHTYRSDTTSPVTLGQGSSYTLKITSLNGKKPVFTPGGKAFQAHLISVRGNDYYYKVTAAGKDGDCNGIYINGEKTPVCVVTIHNILKSDTGKALKVKAGKTYQFKITSNFGKPTFACGTGSVFTVTYNGQNGNNYFFVVKAVGKVGQCAGFYINGAKTSSTIGTVA